MKLQLQTLPGIWISELGTVAWMSLDALRLKYSYMHCICTCRHPHTELVRAGGTVCYFLQSTSLQRLLSEPRHSPGGKMVWNSPLLGALNSETTGYKKQVFHFAHTYPLVSCRNSVSEIFL